MDRRTVTLLLVLALMLAGTVAFGGTRVIATVHAGDQVELEGGWVANLVGITTESPDKPLGQKALELSRSLVEGKRVAFSTWTTDNHASGIVYDETGTAFATVEFGDDRQDLAVVLLKKGLARVDTEHLPDYAKHYVEIEAKAKKAGVGMWKRAQ